MKLIQQGAEAKIYLIKNKISKQRISKSYRLKELDEKIRKTRTKKEVKLLEKASKIISVPKVLKIFEKEKIIEIEFIDGLKLSQELDNLPLKNQKEILNKIGEAVSKLHKQDIIHGDLTTSNMILKDEKVFFIDFGLGFISKKDEDKAVDIHVLKEALEAKHFKYWKELFNAFEKAYKNKKVLERLEIVEKRGRYKH